MVTRTRKANRIISPVATLFAASDMDSIVPAACIKWWNTAGALDMAMDDRGSVSVPNADTERSTCCTLLPTSARDMEKADDSINPGLDAPLTGVNRYRFDCDGGDT